MPSRSPCFGKPLSHWGALWGRLKAGGHPGPLRGVYYLLSVLGLLCHLGGDVDCGKSFAWASPAFICLFGDRVRLGARGSRGADGWRVVHILCSPEGRGDLNPSLVESLIPHLEAVELHTSATSALRASSVSVTPTSYPSCSTCFLAFLASSNFLIKTLIWLLVARSSSAW